jgi:hypothetical protein
MSAHRETANFAGPDDPPPQQEPTYDVPVYPEHDPPPDPETTARTHGRGEDDPPVKGDDPGEGQDDVDEDDLDPRIPHSPPDAGKNKVVFDENKVAG